ncbi:MAG: hypothetical protein ACK44C_08500 [Polaromonas sp.]|jgi:3-hydroxyethyl bacteriochlorophyllide a dehydrogenase
MKAEATVLANPRNPDIQSLGLAGFYRKSLNVAAAPAFKREDLAAVTALAHSGKPSMDGWITHPERPSNAASAYDAAVGDAACLKMILDWKHST